MALRRLEQELSGADREEIYEALVRDLRKT
jgi:hypothetical protein